MDIHEADTLPEHMAVPKAIYKQPYDKVFAFVLVAWIVYVSLAIGIMIGGFLLAGILR